MKKLDTPCGQCGWKLAGFHICVLDFSTPEGLKRATYVESHEVGASSRLNKPPKKRSNRRHQPEFGSEQDRANRSEATRQARAKEEGRAERDKEIIRLYDEELLSMNRTAERLNLDFRTVKRVLHNAAQDGHIQLRVNLGGRPRRDAA